MTPEQAAAFVMAQAACVMAEIAAMQRTNEDHSRSFDANPRFPPYDANAFRALIDRYCIGHNAVLQLFQETNR
jgi:hypothetical protein